MSPTFASPEWLWCLLLLAPLIGLRLWGQFRARRGFFGMVSPRLRGELIVGAHPWAAWGVFSARLLALAALIVAMARPQMGYEVVDTETEGRNLIVAIDASRSMLANDLLPDRLTRAKLAAQDIVNELPEDRIGLIAFAGTAFLQAPLTLDHDAVIEAIEQFDTEIIPRGGTNLASAVSLALDAFRKAGDHESALILFSDGENHEDRDELDRVRQEATRLGTVLVTVGVGTETGAIIPEADDAGNLNAGVFIRDDRGEVVRSRLDSATLQALSRGTGGVYVNLGATTSVAAIVKTALQKIEAVREIGGARRRPIERFLWPLSAAFVLMAAAFLLPGAARTMGRWLAPRKAEARGRNRRFGPARVAALAATALLPAGNATAVPAGQVFESAGFASLQRGNYATAIGAFRREIAEAHPGKRLARLHLGLGSAAYRQGDYRLAMTAFGKALEQTDRRSGEMAHYNLGNSLYRHGEAVLRDALGGGGSDLPRIETDPDKEAIAEHWRAAIEHFEEALKINPANDNALHNIEVVRKRLEILQQPPPEEEQEQPQQEQNREQEPNQPGSNREQDQEQDQDPEQQEDPQAPANGPPPPPEDPPESDDLGPPEDPPPGNERPPDSLPDRNSDQSAPPPPAPPPQDGDLEANPDARNPREPDARNPGDSEVNPDTGFSPAEARQKLEALADEDLDVRPENRVPRRDREFKDW